LDKKIVLIALIKCIKDDICMCDVQKQLFKDTEKLIVGRKGLPLRVFVLSFESGIGFGRLRGELEDNGLQHDLDPLTLFIPEVEVEICDSCPVLSLAEELPNHC
jgi:hypothetical protein